MEMPGLSGRILKGDCGWIIFMTADRDVLVPTHHHGAQWGLVIEGRMELTLGDQCRVYERGETHFIPAGVDHQALLYAGWRGLYVFERPPTA
ncbi:MAG: cupin domain-containing protein [Phycisphaerales bacterium]|nr:cupin domain-containing protein [Phycisphaerales bacterium]